MNAETILQGLAAYLASAQADKLGRYENCDIYQLRTPTLRLGLYDDVHKRLVVIDGNGLAALAHELLVKASLVPELAAQRVAAR